jgi:hypothetical protein
MRKTNCKKFTTKNKLKSRITPKTTSRKSSKSSSGKSTVQIIPYEILINKIFLLREEKVMLDKDLAALYGVKPIRLREQVKRNINKFPSNFMFRLNKSEVDKLVSQNAIPSSRHLGGATPFAFTEHGILMLSNVLKSNRAIEVSIRLIEVFVRLRSMIISNAELRIEIEQLKSRVDNGDKNMQIIFEFLDDLMLQKEKRAEIGYKLSGRKGN